MRKLSLQQYAVSLDGYILEEGTEFYRWWESMPNDDELEEYFVATLRRAGTHIMGRVTYQSMAAHWPTSPEPVAPVLNDIPKVVFSKTLSSADWPESRIAREDTAEEIARLKAEPGGEIVAHGGVRFVQSLARLGVVDEYRLYVYPIAIGSGSSLFAGIEDPQPLRLVSNTAFPSGAVELVYERSGHVHHRS
jgi:dihydrofolate reductase